MTRQRQTVLTTCKEVYCVLTCLFYALFVLQPLTAVANPATISSAPAQQVSVGYDESGSYMYKSDAGEFRGLTIEFLYELAKYTNWEYKFVPFKNWGDAVQSLKDGKIDMLPTMLKTPEREKEMFFSTRRMGNIYVALIVGKNDTRSSYGDLSTLQGKRIGVRRGTVDADKFRDWATNNNLRYTEVEFNGQKDLLQALDQGQIDGAALTYTGLSRAYRAIAEFAPQDMYFAVAPQRRDLFNELDLAMGRIDIMNPGFFVRSRRYMEGESNSIPVFSQAEQDYIKQAPNIRVAVLKDATPFSHLHADGMLHGIIMDLFSYLGKTSGLKFTFVTVASQQEALDAIKNGKADMIGRILDNSFFAHQHNLRLTTPYAKLTLVQLSRRDKENIQTVDLQEPALAELVENSITPSASSLPVATKKFTGKFVILPNMMDSLTENKVDAVYCDSATANYFLRTHRASEYQINFLRDSEYEMSVGISAAADPKLPVIMDKCIRYLSADEMTSIITNNSSPLVHSWTEILNQLPGHIILLVVAILLAIALGMAYLSFLLWRRRGVEKRLTEVRIKNEQMQAQMVANRKITAAKEEFFSHISHDMRTPLNGIIGFTDLAAQEPTLDGTKDYLGKIKISSRILLDLINDTLQLSKLERGKNSFIWEEVNGAEFIKSTLTPIEVIAREKGVNLSIDTTGMEPARIIVDRPSIQKIFLNILNNAVKFTPAGGKVTLTVTSGTVAEGKLPMTFVTQDTGCGISQEFLPKVFDPFAQERRSESSDQPGNGLGLAIVKKLVENFGGTITISSEKNVGTTVTVHLDFAYKGPATAMPKAPVTATTPQVYPQLQGKKVLLCEDNFLNTEIAVKLLQAQGLTVVKAANGAEGVRIFTASAVGELAAILMDLRMPVLDGFGAAQAIRALPRADATTIPILAISADAYEEDVQRCRDAGMNGHLAKPINPQQLYEELAKVIS
jgi:signal transduction histidine kinase/ABC-type amino acid transport substrate-binding protein/CheY-like chemotaxis protein